MFSRLFHKKKTTIYEDYCLYKRVRFWNTTDDCIQFITGRLIKCGLDDVMSLDQKWRKYNETNNTENDITDYLSFLVQLVGNYNNNRDAFITYENIDTI